MSHPTDPYVLPADLPVPVDDGTADHLLGARVPPIALQSTGGGWVRLDQQPMRWVVVYCYPLTGRPGEELPGGTAAWNAIPGARGCTPQSCGYRDHYQELLSAGAAVFGLSTQTTSYQQEMADRLHLPFAVLSDAGLEFASALGLPTFEAAGQVLLKRLTLVLSGERIVRCIYPVFPPDADAAQVLAWLRDAG